MLAQLRTFALLGIDAVPVDVEAGTGTVMAGRSSTAVSGKALQ